MRKAPRVLRTAEFSSRAVRYSLLSLTIVLAGSIVAIPAIPFVLPFAWWYYRRFYATLDVVLTSRELQVCRGVLNRQEKSIPLEKVTDLAVIQGPIMRMMDIKGLQVETAGQSGSGGALVRLIGIVDTDGFRDDALDQRDKVTDAPTTGSEPATADGTAALLVDIRDTLQRIEARMNAD
ncbi:MAG: PH domain-containing protein [Candidatus Wenzhouxiangella sp. M2_3B_020]